MINNELIVSRIKKLMDENKLTPSSFAKKIESKRANISHILSGRNKPSLNFLIKIVNSFDGISLDWFVNDKVKFSEKYKEPFDLKKNDKEDDTSENELAKYGTSTNLTTSMKAMKEIIKEYRNYEYSYGLRSDYDPLSIRTNWELSMSNAIPVLLWLDGNKVSEIVEPEIEGNFISNMSMLGQIIVMVSSIADVIQDSVLKKKMEEAHKLVVRDIVIPNSLYF